MTIVYVENGPALNLILSAQINTCIISFHHHNYIKTTKFAKCRDAPGKEESFPYTCLVTEVHLPIQFH